MEGVSAVVLEEEAVEAEVLTDVARGMDGLVREDCHGDRRVGFSDGGKSFEDAGVDIGKVELVNAVVVEGRRRAPG